jgi:phospholipid/cholesterol/gamma-HCH transport system permease protein
MATADILVWRPMATLRDRVSGALVGLGEWSIFAGRTFGWMLLRRPSGGTLLPIFHFVGVRSMSVIAVTGLFTGMVLAVQMYSLLHLFGLENRLGTTINLSVVRELGPVLAATMLAGRVGSAMAAELATMRITEQVDALACLGINPIHYLVVPRVLACMLLIPLLTIVAEFMGVMGGAFIALRIYHVESHYYWMYGLTFVGMWDLATSTIKPIFFGAAIALISCYRGFNSSAGAEGVGRAATKAFVTSFIVILILDLFLAMLLNGLHDQLWPGAGPRLF